MHSLKLVALAEIFSGYASSESYEGMIRHFLDIRNAVAAHANPSPPRRFMLSEDSIYELQLFVAELGARALGAVSSTGFPRGALLRSSGKVPNKSMHRGA